MSVQYLTDMRRNVLKVGCEKSRDGHRGQYHNGLELRGYILADGSVKVVTSPSGGRALLDEMAVEAKSFAKNGDVTADPSTRSITFQPAPPTAG